MKASFIVCTALLLASCGKHRTIQISAKNAATGAAYPGLHYTVGYSTTTGSGEKSHVVQSGSLDNDGLATVSLHVKRDRTYYVHVDEPENTCYNKFITMYFNSPFDEDGHFNFEFAPCAGFKLDIHNVNCSGPNDDFKLYYFGRQVNDQGSGIVGALAKQGIGCYNYVGSEYSPVPMGKMYWKWIVTRGSLSYAQFDTLSLTEGDNFIYTINY